MIVAGGLHAKVVVYPIAEGEMPGNRLTNWAVLVKVGEGGTLPPRREDWSRPGKRDELMPHVARFNVPHVDVPALISATPEFWEYPCCDRDPLPFWTSLLRNTASQLTSNSNLWLLRRDSSLHQGLGYMADPTIIFFFAYSRR